VGVDLNMNMRRNLKRRGMLSELVERESGLVVLMLPILMAGYSSCWRIEMP
jgi:hypothetical protein